MSLFLPQAFTRYVFDALICVKLPVHIGDDENDLTFQVRGSDGRTMDQYYKENGGPTAYYGTMTAGFPNLFILSGEESTTFANHFLTSY